jgi:hypothetical protein
VEQGTSLCFTELDIDGSLGEAQSLERLIDAPWFERLEKLCCRPHSVELTRALTRAFFRGTNLKSLHLRECPAGDALLGALARSPLAGRIEELFPGRCGITDSGLVALLERDKFPALKRLSIHGNRVTDYGLRRLAAAPLLANLDMLGLLSLVDLSENGLRHLAESPHLGRIAELNLEWRFRDTPAGHRLRERLGARARFIKLPR